VSSRVESSAQGSRRNYPYETYINLRNYADDSFLTSHYESGTLCCLETRPPPLALGTYLILKLYMYIRVNKHLVLSKTPTDFYIHQGNGTTAPARPTDPPSIHQRCNRGVTKIRRKALQNKPNFNVTGSQIMKNVHTSQKILRLRSC
jgi:hypothetical protein